MSNNQVKNENDTRKIFTTLVLVLTLMICTTSATYAYFALSATATNNITGTAATASLYWGADNSSGIPTVVNPNTTYASRPMVPQKSLNGSTDVLQLAVDGGNPDGSATKVPCVDNNGNVVCKIYQFTICNDSTATAKVNGTIQFNWDETVDATTQKAKNKFTNLKYMLMESATEPGTVSSTTIKSATTAADTIITDQVLAADTTTTANTCNGGTQSYNLVVWIEETGTNQNDTDYGTFYATVAFTSSDGNGITSTITG